MGFGDAVKLGFSNYVNFSDRACRSEFWYWALFVEGMAALLFVIQWIAVFGSDSTMAMAITSMILGITYMIFGLATFLPGLSVSVRRLHDLDRSGWWILLVLIPLVGTIILIIWFCAKGTDGPNSARTGWPNWDKSDRNQHNDRLVAILGVAPCCRASFCGGEGGNGSGGPLK
jgi:uncharacterized membrane protein YhaH (DUF805 family)